MQKSKVHASKDGTKIGSSMILPEKWVTDGYFNPNINGIVYCIINSVSYTKVTLEKIAFIVNT